MRDLRGPRFGLLPIVWVGIALSVFQQFVGINVPIARPIITTLSPTSASERSHHHVAWRSKGPRSPSNVSLNKGRPD
jgi:hypothetical protein